MKFPVHPPAGILELGEQGVLKNMTIFSFDSDLAVLDQK
jgi:hypothetical protein